MNYPSEDVVSGAALPGKDRMLSGVWRHCRCVVPISLWITAGHWPLATGIRILFQPGKAGRKLQISRYPRWVSRPSAQVYPESGWKSICSSKVDRSPFPEGSKLVWLRLQSNPGGKFQQRPPTTLQCFIVPCRSDRDSCQRHLQGLPVLAKSKRSQTPFCAFVRISANGMSRDG